MKIDLHVHTSEVSLCGHLTARQTVQSYKEAGYDCLVITNHFNTYTCNHYKNNGEDDFFRFYHDAYLLAKEEGERLGMDVILGAELRFPENDSDYLIYGIDEDWLYSHPYICRMDHKTFFDRFGSEVLIIHAHPYRNCDTVFYDCVHGLEVANCNPRHDSRNGLALALAKAHPRLYRTVGSDAHRPGDEGRAALLSDGPIPDSFALKDVITSGRYRLWCPEYDLILKECEEIPHV